MFQRLTFRAAGLVAGALAITMLAAACGSDEAAAPATSSGAVSASASTSVEASVPETVESSAVESSAASSSPVESSAVESSAVESSAVESSAVETSGSEAPATGAFPVTVSTLFGDVTVEKEPVRIVALGWSDAETALALGVQPVGASDWLAFGGEGVGPWAEGLYTTAPEILGTNEIDFEAVAALKPDLILNTRSDNSAETNKTLSAIAPTIGAPADLTVAYGTTWKQQMELVSAALGKAELGREKIVEVETALTDAATANPEFAGKTVAVGAYFGGNFGAYVTGDSRVDLMVSLGFTQKPELDALADGSFYVAVSGEELDKFDADLTVIFPLGDVAAELKANKTLQSIPSAKAGHLVVLEDTELINAFSSGSTLGTLAAIKAGVPVFAAGLGS